MEPFVFLFFSLFSLFRPLTVFFLQDTQAKAEADYERFLRDLEEDPTMRETIDLFKDQQAAAAKADAMSEDAWSDEEEDFPEIEVDELQDLGQMLDTLAIEEDSDLAEAPAEGGDDEEL